MTGLDGNRAAEIAHILVVDDEPEVAESVSYFLSSREGYHITRAGDGREAMIVLESVADDPSRDIDLVLLDMRMPVISGREVLTWIRKHPKLQFTRVIVLTGATGSQEKLEALSAGANDYITKPYHTQELLARVKTILRSRQLEKQLQYQTRQLAMLNRISRAVTATLATPEVLAVAVRGTIVVLGVETAAIYMADQKQSRLQCRSAYSQGHQVASEAFASIPFGQSVIGEAFSRGIGICLNDAPSDPRFHSDLDGPTSPAVRSMMVAPLFVRGRSVGVITAFNKPDDRFSTVDRNLFDSLASSVSRAIEIAWLFQSVVLRQQELLHSRNTLQAVIDGILHPIYTIDDQWQLISVNRTKANMLDQAADSLTGKECFRIFYDRQAPCEHCEVTSTLAEKQARRWSVRWRGKDHLPEEWDVNAYPIPAAKAGAAQAVVVWQDRTEERRLESSLMHADKMAAIGRLAAGVAHEINNPLTAITANAQMLQMALPAADENIESVDLIVQAGERAATVVRGLLDYAREAQYEFETGDINSSIRQALQLVSYQLSAAGISVDTHLADELPLVDASWEHLKSVWLNLIINARDAVQDLRRQKLIEIATRHDPVNGYIQAIVRDNGQGMSPAELAHIFEPFYTTKAPGQGTGLGLANSHRIIEQHGGEINVASTPGEGTVFVVRLPKRTPKNQSSAKAAA